MMHDNMSPLVSVIVPIVPKHGVPASESCEHVVKCLTSLKSQTMGNFEAICVDDCSNKMVVSSARQVAGDDQRFVFSSLRREYGFAVAFNAALDNSAGKYVMFLDSEDYLVPDALEKIIGAASKLDLDILYFNALQVHDGKKKRKEEPVYYVRGLDSQLGLGGVGDGTGDETAMNGAASRNDGAAVAGTADNASNVTTAEGGIPNSERKVAVASGMDFFSYCDEKNAFSDYVWLRMFKRSLIDGNNLRFYPGINHADVLFVYLATLAAKRCAYLDEAIYMRRIYVPHGSRIARRRARRESDAENSAGSASSTHSTPSAPTSASNSLGLGHVTAESTAGEPLAVGAPLASSSPNETSNLSLINVPPSVEAAIREVNGWFVVARELHVWLRNHANKLDDRSLYHASMSLAKMRISAGRAWEASVPSQYRDLYLNSLSDRDKARFYLDVEAYWSAASGAIKAELGSGNSKSRDASSGSGAEKPKKKRGLFGRRKG